jgi:hypothetical protein
MVEDGAAEAVVLNAFVVEDPIIPYQCTGATVRAFPKVSIRFLQS